MIKDSLLTAISQALEAAALPQPPGGVDLDPPKRRDQGDWSTNAAMKLQKTKERLDVADADISGSAFDNVNFSGCNFHNVNLSGATFEDINMSGWRVTNVNLSGLKLSDVNLAGASITGGRYYGMTIDGVDVTELLAARKASAEKASE